MANTMNDTRTPSEILADAVKLAEMTGHSYITVTNVCAKRIIELMKELDFYKKHEHEVCANCPLDERNAVKPKRGRAWTQKAWFCGKCDFRLNMAGSFCAKCGTPVNWETADT